MSRRVQAVEEKMKAPGPIGFGVGPAYGRNIVVICGQNAEKMHRK